MQITLDDFDEIEAALVQWMRIWAGVRIQREEWVRKQMDAGRPGFAEHNRKAIETAKEHCARTSRIINKIKQMQEEIYEWNERPPEEIDIMCHVTSIKEEAGSMMKLWDSLTDEGKNAVLIAAFLVEAWFLLGVLA